MYLLTGVAPASTITFGDCVGKINVRWCKSDDSKLLYTNLGTTNNFAMDKMNRHVKQISIMSGDGILWKAEFRPENYWLFNITANNVSTSYKDGECTTTLPIKQNGSSKDCVNRIQPYKRLNKFESF